MKLARLSNTVFLLSLAALLIVWGFLPRVWVLGWPQLALLGLAAVSILAWFVFSLEGLRLWMKKRSTRFALGLALTAVAAVALLGTINYLASLYNVKKDLTVNELHTLSAQTKSLLGGLKEDITLRVWTRGIDRMATNIDMKRFLENFEQAGKGHVKLEIRNPNEDPAGSAQDNVKRDNVLIVRSSSGREARVESFNETKGEEQITNAIVQALKGQKKTVCFLSGHGELATGDTQAQGLSEIKGKLEGSSYTVQEVSLASAEKLPSACEVLVIAGPRGEAVERESAMLREYLSAGGKAIALLGPGTPKGWRTLIGEFGATVRSDIIIDPRVRPPIAIATKNFAQDVEIVKSFDRLVLLPETSSIEVGPEKDGLKIRTFVSSEAYTFAKAGDLKTLRALSQTTTDLRGPLPVGVLIRKSIVAAPSTDPAPLTPPGPPAPGKTSGRAEGWWNRLSPVATAHAQEGEVDQDAEPPSLPVHAAPPGGAPSAAPEGPKTPSVEMSLVVFSNQNFVMNSFVNQLGNLDLFMNSVVFLLKDQDLIGIRPRELRQASLELSPENLRQVYATVLLLAGAFLTGGVLARRRKAAVEG
jgi:ABC-type uncharacterized transport system involved in gliding motility auxiliary subunit